MFIHQKRIILNFNSYLFLFRSSLFPNLFITCLGRERKNVGEGTVKVVICLDLAIKLGNGRAVTFVLESADALHGRLSLPPLRQGIFLIHATMRCTRANKHELSQRGVERPLAFSFFFSLLQPVVKRPGTSYATMNIITVTFTFFQRTKPRAALPGFTVLRLAAASRARSVESIPRLRASLLSRSR